MLKFLLPVLFLASCCPQKGTESPAAEYPWDNLDGDLPSYFANDLKCVESTKRVREIFTWKVTKVEESPGNEYSEPTMFKTASGPGDLDTASMLYAKNTRGEWVLIYMGDFAKNLIYVDYYWILMDKNIDVGAPFGNYFCADRTLDQM